MQVTVVLLERNRAVTAAMSTFLIGTQTQMSSEPLALLYVGIYHTVSPFLYAIPFVLKLSLPSHRALEC